MNIEWVRVNVRAALNDTYISGNGQLGNLAERARVETSRFNRNPPRFIAVNGRMVRVPSYPLTTKQTRVKDESVALIHEVDYYLVSWRRAISRLDEPLQAWIRYCYGGYPYRNEQRRVVPYVWDKFIEQQTGRISGKVKQRLQGLVLLAVQVVASEIRGCTNHYVYTELADIVGIDKKNWHKNYQEKWLAIKCLILEMDRLLLLNITRKIKNTKGIAKLDFWTII